MANIVYPSKVLLFGEYAILRGANAFSIPNPHFSGSLELFDPVNPNAGLKIMESNMVLKQLYGFLRENRLVPEIPEDFDFHGMETDIQSGIYFKSDIPLGYGLGSSGALVAAVYHKYALRLRSVDMSNLSEIKKQLAYIESFFHYNSSGIDPLVSLLKVPLLYSETGVSVVDPSKSNNIKPAFTLIDSGIQRKSANFVGEFTYKLQDTVFQSSVNDIFIPSNNRCIEAFIQGDNTLFFEQLRILSEFQYKYMKWLIPEHIQIQWEESFKTGDYLKLCGAGSGGYFLKFHK